jgi:hypothetical protein
MTQALSEISELVITVSSLPHPYYYLWLWRNDATQPSTPSIVSSALDIDRAGKPNDEPKSWHGISASEWRLLFELLATRYAVPNSKRLELFEGCEG